MDWYTPRRLLNSDSDCDFSGDRFIPNRSLMNLDQAHVLLTTKNKKGPPPKYGDAYRQKINENLTLDSRGKPFRMLVFRGNPKPNQKPTDHDDVISRIDDKSGLDNANNAKKYRKIPTKASAILAAPNLKDNFYQNVLDWGENNTVAIALGREIYLWNAENKKIWQLPNYRTRSRDDYPSSLAWSGDAKAIATGHFSSEIQLWDAETLKLVRKIKGHRSRVSTLAWNGHILTSGSMDQNIINHDVRVRNSMIHHVHAHRGEVCGLKWSASGLLLASGGNDNRVCIWDVSKMSSGKSLHRFKDHKGSVKALAWCPYDTHILATGGGTSDGTIKMWNVQKGTCINSVQTESQVCGLEWNKHHKELLSGHGFSTSTNVINTLRNSMCLWKYPSMSRIVELTGHDYYRVLNLSQSPDGLTVVSIGGDETLRMWNIFGPSSSASSSFSIGGMFSQYRSNIR